jgi:hypothetical protein
MGVNVNLRRIPRVVLSFGTIRVVVVVVSATLDIEIKVVLGHDVGRTGVQYYFFSFPLPAHQQ